MKFTIVKNQLKVKSESGKTYIIDREGCNCPGFGWRRNCRHFTEAKVKGLLDKLPKNEGFHGFVKTPYIVKMRKDAIKQWLKKKRYKVTEKVIDKIESIMTATTSMKEVLACVKGSR